MICYCVADVMSRCIAENAKQQDECYFSEKSTGECTRCMFRIEAIGNHCDCQAAQKFARGVASGEEMELAQEPLDEEEELNIDEFLEEEMPVLASCINCYRFIHCHTQPPGFADAEMEKAAATCAAYRKKADWEKSQLPF